MAVTVASFRSAFPEFTNAPEDAVVQRCIDTATTLNAGLDSTVKDEAVQYLAAHFITRDPRGEPVAMRPYGGAANVQATNVSKGNRAAKGTSQYLETYERILAANVIPAIIA